jgi:simple sugar transport system permease protein
LARQTPLFYLAAILTLVVPYVLARTPLGLAIRACGDNPLSVEATGRSVNGIRIGVTTIGAAMMAIGGATMTLGLAQEVSAANLNGRGFLCIALVTIAGWRVAPAIAIALAIGLVEAYLAQLQPAVAGPASQLALIAPYLIALAGVLVLNRQSSRPRALGQRYGKGDRANAPA